MEGTRDDNIEVVTDTSIDEESWFEPKLVLKDVKSAVWEFFKFKGTKADGPNKSKVYCSICIAAKKDSVIAYSGGTTNLATHMKKYHANLYSNKIALLKYTEILKYIITILVHEMLL